MKLLSWRKISAFKANKTFANKTLRAEHGFCKVSQWRGSCSLEKHTLPFAKKDTVSLFKKGI